ncbi:MAG: NAD-dependent malic enzyme [Planctomycetaceae bacterium]|nr:NAD-dependent malic enzyme [Planctomycetaceae bacterium]
MPALSENRTAMESREALHDRFGRNTVFDVLLRFSGDNAALAAAITAITDAGARVGNIDFTAAADKVFNYRLQVFTSGDAQMAAAKAALEKTAGFEVTAVLDAAMEAHRGGSTYIKSRIPIRTNTDLRIVYTPGVARVCKAIEAKPELARTYTGIGKRIAICTDGTAILGLGNIGTVAGLPVMEGKAAIFAEFAGLSAEAVLINTRDSDDFVHVMETIAGSYGAIQVEDVKAPECFAITRELDRRLDIPVMHDDQHGTATIVLAGLFSALKQIGKKMGDLRCAISGAGAAGTAIADLLVHCGIADVVLVDSRGIVEESRGDLNEEKKALARRTNKGKIKGSLADALKGRELFIGVSQPNIVTQDMVRSMAPRPLVFPLANPVSEISRPDALAAGAALYADGRIMNNALAYPGLFRGALEAGAKIFTLEMLIAAAEALVTLVPPGQLLPEMMDPATHEAVAAATVRAAAKSGTAINR